MAIMGAVFKGIAKKGLKKAKEKKEKENKGKETIKKIIMAAIKAVLMLLLKIMIPVIIAIILLAGFWSVIKGDHHDTTTSSYSSAIGTTGASTTVLGTAVDENGQIINPSIIVEPGTNGRYNIIYDITEEEEKEVSDFLSDAGIELTEENIKFIAALVKHGYKLETYNKKEYLEAMFLFFKAETASQSLDLRPENEMYVNGVYNPPSFEGEGIPGIVRINQYRVNPENNNEITENHLTYIAKEEFSNNTAGHFTINENGTLIVAKTSEMTTVYEYPQGYTGKQEQGGTIYNTQPNPVNFRPIIAKSTLPFNLMATLMVYIEDAEFYTNMANTVLKSNIVLALKEEETKTITETTRTYTPRTEEYYDFSYIVSYNANTANTTIHTENNIASIGQARAFLRVNYGYTGMFESGVDEWDWNGAHYRATYNSVNKKLTITKTVASGNTISEPERKEEPLKPIQNKLYTKLTPAEAFNVKETTTTKTYKQEVEIKEIKNWFMDYNIEGYGGEASTNTDGPNEITIDIPEYDGVNKAIYSNFETQENIPDDSIMKTFREQKENEITNRIGYNPQYTWNINGINYKKTENFETKTSTIVTTTTTTITNGKEHKEYRKQDSEGSFLYYYDKSDSAQGAFNSASGMIFEALEKDTQTIDQVNILKYLLYLYTGNEDYNVDPIDLNSLVGTIGFTNFGGGSTALLQYLYGFEHGNSQVPMDPTGKYYKMYGDGAGNATIGLGMQWKSQYEHFEKPGMVLENGVEQSVPNVALYVKNKLGEDHYAKLSNEEIDALGIYLDKEMVDQVVENSIEIWEKLVDSKTAGLSLSYQQRYALIELCYARGGYGLKWEEFRKVYLSAPANSPEQLKKIWDEWWINAGIGPNSLEGVLNGQDAAFETYVKGTVDFRNPWTPSGMGNNGDNVFDRKYYLFFSQQQINSHKNAKIPTARTNHEGEIFVYEENKSIGASSELVSNIISLAYQKIGCPYTRDYPGRIGPNSFDCSGFIYWLYYVQHGINVPGTTSAYFDGNWDGYKVYENTNGLTDSEMKANLLPGDAIVYNNGSEGHVVLYVGENKIIHAANPKRRSGTR